MRICGRLTLISLVVTLVVWGIFSWPLPRYVGHGIPSSAHNVETHNVRRMVAGDHLQLHYFYWIFSDMLIGGTPFWHNLYEFNTGDDAARRQVGNYNMPFSFVYVAGRVIGGPAFGWNLTGFVTLWGTLLATWLLIRRHTRESRLSLLCALLAIVLPYRWMTLLGGSPTGFAMLWVPVLLLGLDMAGRDDSFNGGLLASAALMLAYWNDPHTFFFCVLFIPLGYLYGFVRRGAYPWSVPSGWRQALRGVLPVAVVVVGLAVIGMMVKRATFAGTNMGDGRGIREVMLFAPRLRGLLGWRANHPDDQIFIGYALPVFFAAHLVALPFVLARRRAGVIIRHGLLLFLLYGSLIAVALLAMGPRGPFSAILFQGCRRLLPGYNMIRQTGKIYALMPVLLALATAVAGMDLLALFRRWRRPAAMPVLVAVVVLAACVEYRAVISPTVCLLDETQPAYEAVSRDAALAPAVEHAHALVLPLWPGDSHWASLYQHYVSLYRIRMINGYSPIVSHAYREAVFERFSSGNGGLLDDSQLDELLSRGIHYVLFHEDAYPEQISAYPVVLALRRLLNHPRLELLAQGGSVRSFRIRPEAAAVPADATLPDGPYFPSARWNATNGLLEGGEWKSDASAQGGQYARLEAGASFALRHYFNHMFAPDPHLWIRARGRGQFRLDRVPHDADPVLRRLDSSEWEWVPVPLPTDREDMHVRLDVLEGSLDVDMLTLVGGVWMPPEAGEVVSFPACLFFRAGYTDTDDGSVTLRPDYEAASVIVYGPRLPFAAGDYVVTFRYTSDAPEGTELGSFSLFDGNSVSDPVPVVQGFEAVTTYRHRWNLPLSLKFTFSREAALSVKAIDFQHIAPLHE